MRPCLYRACVKFMQDIAEINHQVIFQKILIQLKSFNLFIIVSIYTYCAAFFGEVDRDGLHPWMLCLRLLLY